MTYRAERRRYTPEEYAAWRAKIPFTNEQFRDALLVVRDRYLAQNNQYFADIFERMAAKAMQGILSGGVMRATLPELVKLCAICGKTALYRYGASGRCKSHKMIRSVYWIEQQARFEARGRDISARLDDKDASARNLDRLHKAQFVTQLRR